MPNTTVNISLPEAMKAQIEEAVSNDGYGNTSEFFRELVRNYLKTRKDARLEELLLEGLESGDAIPSTRKDFEEIKARGLERIQKKTKNK